METNKKILVTGAAGFLGSHLADKLVEMGHKVIGIDSMIGGYEDNISKKIEFHKIDCCDLKKVQEIMCQFLVQQLMRKLKELFFVLRWQDMEI